MTKQEQINDLYDKLHAAYDEINALKQAKSKDFETSPLYQQMHRELLLATTIKEHEDRFRREIRTDLRLQQEILTLRRDNKELCKAHDEDYWEGISYRPSDRDYERQERELTDLRAALAAKDAVIERLKAIIAGEEPKPPKSNPVGHPRKIDDAAIKRIRKYRKDGWTMQQIADAEGISKGSVCAICKDTNNKKP